MNYALRDYGNRVGFWRMIEVLDHFKIRATASINMAVLDYFPEIRDAMVDRDWDFMSHGIYNTRYMFGMNEVAEREFYRSCIASVHRHTGKKLKGMLGTGFSASPNTPKLMAEEGLIYHADWFIDDQPFPINVPRGRLVGVPYSADLNDGTLFNGYPYHSFEADYFLQVCKDQFDVLYQEGERSGRVMNISLHPFAIGRPHRVKFLSAALEYILSHEGVWLTTGDEIAEYYLSQYYDSELVRLAGAAVSDSSGHT